MPYAEAARQDYQEDGANLSGYSFTSIGFGAARDDRYVAALVWWQGNSAARTLSSCTIGGQSASIHVQQNSGSGTHPVGLALVSALVTSGTSGTVATTMSGGCLISGCTTIRGIKFKKQAAHHTASIASDAGNMSLNIPHRGLGIGGVVEVGAGGTFTVTGLGEVDDRTLGGGGGSIAVAISDRMDKESGRTVSFNSSGSPTNIAAVCASWR